MNFTREPIFISALRGFLKAFAVVLGITFGLVAVLIGFGALSNNVELPDKGKLTVCADAAGNRKLLASSTPVLLRIDLHGVIGTKNLSEKTFANMLLDSREGALTKNRVKGILLHINSPGGLATTSNTIYHALKDYKEKYKVPVYVYVDGMCASGGMYIACAADKIYATQNSIIGSIGVRLGPAFNVSEIMEKIGIQSKTLTRGKDKDTLNPFRPWREGEDAALQDMIAVEYQQFVNTVINARKKMSREKLINDYGANVFIAPDAEDLGYIDQSGVDYYEALKALATAAGITDNSYQVFCIEPAQSVLKELTQNKWGILRGKIEHVFPIGPYMTSEMSGKLLYLYQP